MQCNQPLRCRRRRRRRRRHQLPAARRELPVVRVLGPAAEAGEGRPRAGSYSLSRLPRPPWGRGERTQIGKLRPGSAASQALVFH